MTHGEWLAEWRASGQSQFWNAYIAQRKFEVALIRHFPLCIFARWFVRRLAEIL